MILLYLCVGDLFFFNSELQSTSDYVIFDGCVRLDHNSCVEHHSCLDDDMVVDNNIVADKSVLDDTVTSNGDTIPDDTVDNLGAVSDRAVAADDTLFDSCLLTSLGDLVSVSMLLSKLIDFPK